MKQYIYLFSLVILCNISSSTIFAQPTESQDIALDKGNTGGNDGGIIRAMSFSISPVEVIITENTSIDIYFNSNMGALTTLITNKDGVMCYSTTVDTSVSGSLSVDISNLPENNYTIVVVDATGRTVAQKTFSKVY